MAEPLPDLIEEIEGVWTGGEKGAIFFIKNYIDFFFTYIIFNDRCNFFKKLVYAENNFFFLS